MLFSTLDKAMIWADCHLANVALGLPTILRAPDVPDAGGGGGSTDIDTFFGDDWGKGGESDGIFGGLLSAAKSLGSSAYSLFFYVVLMCASIATLIVCLKLIFGGAQGKAEGKSSLLWVIVAVAIAACAISLVKVIATGAATLFS